MEERTVVVRGVFKGVWSTALWDEGARPKMKAILRCWKIRRLDLLPDAIQKALSCVSSLDCSHWFAASDYCQILDKTFSGRSTLVSCKKLYQ